VRGHAIEAIHRRLQQIDLSPLLIYRIDSVPAEALPFLQWQFDILSPEWVLITSGLAPGSAGLRQLIKSAIPLHKTLGTPAALKTAFAALGWPNAVLFEGQNSWSGSSWPSNEGWAVFRVQFALSQTETVSAVALAQLTAAANFFKPERCWLDSIWFVLPPINDIGPIPTDEITLTGAQEFVADIVPPPADSVTNQATTKPINDSYPRIAPMCDGHFFATGHLCGGGSQPSVADGPIVVNGVAQNAK
jgi:P2-related tail formation protein